MGLSALRTSLSEITKAGYYSIIADQTADVSHQKQLVVCIRWIDNKFEIHGVAAQIQHDAPSALYIHCFTHCINLCVQTIGRQGIPIQDALDLARVLLT